MRLFVAVWPPPPFADLLAALPRPEVAGLRWTRSDQWHVTLRFLGSVDDVDAVIGALSVLSAVAAVEAVAGPAVGRFGQRVLHVPVDGLAPVASAVVGATADIGEAPDSRPFAGHVTLARVGDRKRVDLRPLTGTPVAARWLVDEVTLVSSDLHPHGARYTVVERFSLPAAPAPGRPLPPP